MSDISDTLAPKSNQLDAVDLLDGPRIFTITECVTRSSEEQPTTIKLAEFPRPWKPGKNQRRVLAYCWGGKGSLYAGRRVELYCDTSVLYAGEKVGGIRIRALSHIDGPMDAPIIPTRGKGGTWHVEPLTEAPAPVTEPTPDQVASCTDPDTLRSWLPVSRPVVQQRINQRIAELVDGPNIPAATTGGQ